MGTNFYLKEAIICGELTPWDKSDDPEFHLGKRSAAGLYCWDCNTTLCIGGIEKVHTGHEFYENCPVCGKKPIDENWETSSSGRELGFNKSVPGKKSGVRSCASFTWALPPEILDNLSKKGKPIIDEYGNKISVKGFRKILEECPIQYKTSIGTWFC